LEPADVVVGGDGAVDAVATFNNPQNDVAKYTDPATGEQKGGNYGAFIAAPITQDLAPYISPRVQDDQVKSKRAELFRLDKAANQAKVRFRFDHAGTDSWYWGIDDFGLYNISSNTGSKLTVALQGTKIVLSWTGAANTTLQRTVGLTSPNWQDVPGTAGAST